MAFPQCEFSCVLSDGMIWCRLFHIRQSHTYVPFSVGDFPSNYRLHQGDCCEKEEEAYDGDDDDYLVEKRKRIMRREE